MSERSVYRGRVRLPDERGRRQARVLAATWEELRFDTVTPSQASESYGTHTFTLYATGGVAIPGTEGAEDVLMAPWTDGAGTVYFFQWDSGASKMKVTAWDGNELAAATDLSAVTNHAFRAILVSGLTNRVVRRLSGTGRISSIEFEVASDFAANATDYWTITAAIRRADALTPQTVGEPFASYSTQERSLVAYSDVVLYTDELGVLYHDSDRLSIVAAPQGNPSSLVGLSVWAAIQREVF